MRRPIAIALSVLGLLLPATLSGQSAPDLTAAQRQVFAAESAFAASFARRDTAAFAALLAPDAIFFGGGAPLRGSAAVAEGWRGMLTEATPPFSWKPEIVEVLAGGELAFSSGPVLDPEGKRVATFNSVWRRQADGRWLVVFDKGSPFCPPPSKQP